MVKKIAAVAGGVFIGLIIAFARVGAFPFWGSDSDASKAQSAQQAQSAQAEPLPAPPVPGIHVVPAAPNTPEPNEKVGVITSFAPLVKRMIPAVVSVRVVQDVKVSGMPFGPQAGPGDRDRSRAPAAFDPRAEAVGEPDPARRGREARRPTARGHG